MTLFKLLFGTSGVLLAVALPQQLPSNYLPPPETYLPPPETYLPPPTAPPGEYLAPPTSASELYIQLPPQQVTSGQQAPAGGLSLVSAITAGQSSGYGTAGDPGTGFSSGEENNSLDFSGDAQLGFGQTGFGVGGLTPGGDGGLTSVAPGQGVISGGASGQYDDGQYRPSGGYDDGQYDPGKYRPTNSGQYSPVGDDGSYRPDEYPTFPPIEDFEFAYAVKDEASGNDYAVSETNKGGAYRVKLPDGRYQIVQFQIDANGIYRTKISYIQANQ